MSVSKKNAKTATVKTEAGSVEPVGEPEVVESYPWLGQGDNITTTLRVMAACAHSHQPCVLVGDPGEGKTSLILALGAALHRPMVYLSMASIQSEDMTGLPYVDHDTSTLKGEDAKLITQEGGKVIITKYAINDWQRLLIENPDAILFCDELNTASPSTMKTFLPIFQNRIFANGTSFSENVLIVGAVNPDSQSGGYELSLAMRNRITWLPFKMSFEDWSKGMIHRWKSDVPMLPPKLDIDDSLVEEREARAARLVVDYLDKKNAGVFSEFAARADNTYQPSGYGISESEIAKKFVFDQAIASGRSWDNLVRLLACFDLDKLFQDPIAGANSEHAWADLFEALVSGTVGWVLGVGFENYVREQFKKRITPETFMDAKKREKINWDKVTIDQMLPLIDGLRKKAEEGYVVPIMEGFIYLHKTEHISLIQSSIITEIYHTPFFQTALKKKLVTRAKLTAVRRAYQDEMVEVFNKATE